MAIGGALGRSAWRFIIAAGAWRRRRGGSGRPATRASTKPEQKAETCLSSSASVVQCAMSVTFKFVTFGLAGRRKRSSAAVVMALRNMLDGDGQDQYDAGGWCFPKPIPPVQRNGDWMEMACPPPRLFSCRAQRVDSTSSPLRSPLRTFPLHRR